MTMTSAFFQNFSGATNAVKGARSLGISGKQEGGSFFSMVRRVVQSEPQLQGTPTTDTQPSNKLSATRRQPLPATSFQSRINDLRESFLSRGTPLDQVVLSDSDLADLRSILEELGFPREHMDTFFQGMMEDRRGTDISLSDFFQDFSQYVADVEAADTALSSGMHKIIDSAAIPHFESVLRDLGVSVEAVNAIFSSSMDQEGNLDMERLIPQLKKIDISRDARAGDVSGANAAQAVSGEGTQSVLTRRMESGLKRMGVDLPGYKAGDSFTLGDLIGVMEAHAGVTRTAGTPSSGNMDADANDVVSGISVDQAGDNEDVAMFFGHAREMMLRDSFGEQYFDTPVKNNKGPSAMDTRGAGSPTIPSSSTSSASPETIDLSSVASTDAKPVSAAVSASAKPSASESFPGMDANKMSGGDDQVGRNGETIEISNHSRGIVGTTQNASSVTSGTAVDPLRPDRTSGTETARVLGTWGFGVAAPDRFMIKKDASSLGRGLKNNGRSINASTGNPDASAASSGTTFEVNTTATAGQSDFSKSVHALIDGIVSGDGNSKNGNKGKESWSEAPRESIAGADRLHGFGQTSGSGFNTTVHESPAAKGGEFQPRFPEHAVTQVGKEIASFLQRGDRVLKLQLKPVELGTVNIEMDVKENVMKLSIVAETSAAKEMFIANHNELRRVLEGYGVKLEALDVQTDGSFEQSLADGNESSPHQEQKNQRWRGRTLDDTTAVADIRPMSMNPDALLDLLV